MLSTSDRITARRALDDASRALASAVTSWQVVDSTANAEAMLDALRAYTDAMAVLDA